MEISVIVPVYNVEKFLPKCLDSLCAQAECVKEIILVDDGSTDNSLCVCKKYAMQDNRVRIIHKDNGGVMSSIIHGIREAHCDYIGFMDSDDYAAPSMYCKMANMAETTLADVIICDFYRDYGEKIEYQHGLPKDLRQNIIDKSNTDWRNHILPTLRNPEFIPPFRWNKLFKRQILIGSEGLCDNNIRVGEDIAMLAPILLSVNRIAYVKEALYYYYQRDNSLVHNYEDSVFLGWKNLIKTLKNVAKNRGYMFSATYNDISLALLLSICLYKIHISKLTFAEKEMEYRKIGEDSEVQSILRDTKIKTSFKHKIVFYLLKCRMYKLLAKVY